MKQIIKIPSAFFKNLFDNKRFVIVLSLISAFAFWLVIMIKQNPEIERTFTDINVNINLENTYASENGMKIIGDLSSQKFTVTVHGPSYVVSALNSRDLYVYASAAAINEPGEYKLDVVGAKSNAVSDFEIVSVTPGNVNVTFDYIESKEFTLKAVADGATASKGLIAETPVVSGAESDSIKITGPRTVINQIETVQAYSKVNKTLSESTTFDAQIILLNSQNEPIDMSNLTLSTTDLSVTVPISKRVTVPVVADFTNLPSDFSKDSISYDLNVDSVSIIGTPTTIDKIKNVTLAPIDITNVSTASNKFVVLPKLPDGVRLLDNIENFTVTVNTSEYAERVFNVSDIRYNNLAGGLTASSDSTVKNVKICGPKSVISKLNAEELFATVDLTDKGVGEHTVAVTVKANGHNNIWQVGSYSTTVKIK